MRQRGAQRRFRPVFMLLLLGVVAFIMYYLRCGDGFGLGPGGSPGGGADGERVDRGEKEASDVRPAVEAGGSARRCRLRLDADGLHIDGRRTSAEKAVAACKKAGGAELTPTGDAVYGELQRVREALDRAGVEVFVRDPGTVPGR